MVIQVLVAGALIVVCFTVQMWNAVGIITVENLAVEDHPCEARK